MHSVGLNGRVGVAGHSKRESTDHGKDISFCISDVLQILSTTERFPGDFFMSEVGSREHQRAVLDPNRAPLPKPIHTY